MNGIHEFKDNRKTKKRSEQDYNDDRETEKWSRQKCNDNRKIMDRS